MTVQDPTNANRGQCHGLVHTDAKTPVTLTTENSSWAEQVSQLNQPAPHHWSDYRWAEDRDSGMNLADKADLTRPWDVHAARQVQCTDCHFSLNNPVYFQEAMPPAPTTLSSTRGVLTWASICCAPCTTLLALPLPPVP